MHDASVTTCALRIEQPVPLDGVKRWLDTILWEKAAVADIYRIKGALDVAGSDRRHVVQVCLIYKPASEVVRGILRRAQTVPVRDLERPSTVACCAWH